jgi:hypothetical protein
MTAIIIDTNLLVLLVVGQTSPTYIAKHKRLKAYSKEDYELLLDVLSGAATLAVTPHILTETSNLLANIDEPAKSRIRVRFREMIGLETTDERRLQSKDVSRKPEFMWLGLADVSLLDACSSTETLLTADFDLHSAALARGKHSLNFTHLREAAGLL